MGPFIPNVSTLIAPPRELSKEKNRLRWYPAHQVALNDITDSVSSTVTLTYFDPKKETTLRVDASIKAVGATLIQDANQSLSPAIPLQMLKKGMPILKESYWPSSTAARNFTSNYMAEASLSKPITNL